ncbi:MAG: response regulator [Deltaproteobacteria bacterium]|nr:response regulator [Deltaproteobacteria bacterium]
MKILVVDDYPGAAEITCVLLRLLGHEPTAAMNAAQALAAVESFEPDIIVLDLGLPDKNGYAVARAVRARGGKRPFIAAMTGRSSTDDRAQSLAAGIDIHILKPASADNLTKIIDTARAFNAGGAADRA